MWASQLFTLQATVFSRREVIMDFTSVPNYEAVWAIELVMFNCPEKGISVQTITILSAPLSLSTLGAFNVPNITSCDSLVRVCIPVSTTDPVIALRFNPPPGSTWVHLAEVEFYGNGSTCPSDTITTTPMLTATSCKLCKDCMHRNCMTLLFGA
jgi:hypothetical protein